MLALLTMQSGGLFRMQASKRLQTWDVLWSKALKPEA